MGDGTSVGVLVSVGGGTVGDRVAVFVGGIVVGDGVSVSAGAVDEAGATTEVERSAVEVVGTGIGEGVCPLQSRNRNNNKRSIATINLKRS